MRTTAIFAKIRMCQRLMRCDSFFGIKSKHSLQKEIHKLDRTHKISVYTYFNEIFCKRINFKNHVSDASWPSINKIIPQHCRVIRPLGFRGRSEHFEYFCQLVHLILPREQGFPCKQLCEDTPNRPDVHGCGVCRPKQDFWRAVPQRHNLLLRAIN